MEFHENIIDALVADAKSDGTTGVNSINGIILLLLKNT
jgi:hypothetical protein